MMAWPWNFSNLHIVSVYESCIGIDETKLVSIVLHKWLIVRVSSMNVNIVLQLYMGNNLSYSSLMSRLFVKL